ncbi:hypothetical protein [Nonomuraea sp. NPDC050643]|uniref:hypothetical protein n=1 Tax=Nonomuraea sp. NPDC050643 TaxID=3155660 RepID=UPI0033FB45F8
MYVVSGTVKPSSMALARWKTLLCARSSSARRPGSHRASSRLQTPSSMTSACSSACARWPASPTASARGPLGRLRHTAVTRDRSMLSVPVSSSSRRPSPANDAVIRLRPG